MLTSIFASLKHNSAARCGFLLALSLLLLCLSIGLVKAKPAPRAQNVSQQVFAEGYTLVTGISMMLNPCGGPGGTVEGVVSLSGSGSEQIEVTISGPGASPTSCSIAPNGSCKFTGTLPNEIGGKATYTATAKGRKTQGGAEETVSAQATSTVRKKQWEAAPAMAPLRVIGHSVGLSTGGKDADGTWGYAAGATVRVLVDQENTTGIVDKDTCTQCDVSSEVDDEITYTWSASGPMSDSATGAENAREFTMPATVGATITVTVVVDDKAVVDAATEEGSRKDGPQTLSLTLVSKEKDGPTDPTDCPTGMHKDANGDCVPDNPGPNDCPTGMHKDANGDCVPDNPGPNDCPAGMHKDANGNCVPDNPTGPKKPGEPQAIALTAEAKSPSAIDLSWGGESGSLHRALEGDFTPSADNLVAKFTGETSTTDSGLTAETTYYYTFVPSAEGYTNGSANATTKAKTAISLTATAKSSVAIELTWTGGAGTLYRSTEAGFEPSSETRVDRGDDEGSDAKTSYLDTGLEKDTTYYYILVPKSKDYEQGKVSAKTMNPVVTVKQLNITPKHPTVEDFVESTLQATLTGDVPDGEVDWDWKLVKIQYRATEDADVAWQDTQLQLVIANEVDASTAYTSINFPQVGFYRIEVKATAYYQVDGKNSSAQESVLLGTTN